MSITARAWVHLKWGSSTFAGTPAGCAAGLKTLELYERLNLVENAARLGEMARETMGGWEEKYQTVRQVRLNGLLMGVSFQSPNEDEKDLWYAREIRKRWLFLRIPGV